MTALSQRHDFVLVFDVTNGNPNGDPDAGNLPRLDPETNHGLVSDVSLKRKIRNYVELAREGQTGHHIYVQEGAILNEKHRQAYVALRPDDPKAAKDAKLNPKDDAEAAALRDFMCRNFFDVRTFGAVMSTAACCGYCLNAALDTRRATSALRVKNRCILLPSSVRSASRWYESSSTPRASR